MRYISFALALFVVSSVHADGGLRRLRREVDHESNNNQGVVDSAVDSNFLDLAKEVQGSALHRVLRHQQENVSRNRKMLSFVSYFDLLHGRNRPPGGLGSNSDPWIGDTPVPTPPPSVPEDVERGLSMSLSLSMSMPLSDRINDVEKNEDFVDEDLSLSMSLSMSLPLDSRIKDRENGADKDINDQATEDIANEDIDGEELSLSLSLSMSI